MNEWTIQAGPLVRRSATALLLAGAGTAAFGQSSEGGAAGLSTDPSPYYLGGSQGFTHDSNVYGVPFGRSDNYSSTSLLAGFDQRLSRQRVFGSANVSLNRYQDVTRLNNTSYGLIAGVDWATIAKLTGNVTTTLDQRLAAPTASGGAPVATRNLEQRQGISGLARWGGDGLLSLESRLGYSSLDYSADEYVASESNYRYGSFGVFYRPGSLLRVGVAARLDHTRTPKAVQLSDGSFVGNTIRGRNLDLLADYDNGSSLGGSGRLSYTKQNNSTVDDADFSGLTGSLNVNYRATGKIAFNLAASRDAGFNNASGRYAPAVAPTPVATPAPTTPPTASPAASQYENNKVTNSLALGASYAATSKIGMSAGARYARARIVTSTAAGTSASQARADTVDRTKGASLSASYAYSRLWTFSCGLTRDRREVSGGVSYAYNDSSASCSARALWR